jgi:putative spermidine/putrescine transport system permease protein
MASVIMPQGTSTPSAGRSSRASAGGILLRVALISAVLYLVLPLFSTVAFSLATVWSRTILPEGYTLEWYIAAVSDDRFWPTTIHTLQATLGAAIISPLLVVPALLAVHLRAPKWKPWLEFLSIVPWALPGVVLALAMIRAYISPFNVSRPGLLILTYVLLSLPFMFRSIDASLSAIDARTLAEAAQMLGAGWFDIGRRILLPGIMPGLMSGVLLIAALGAGEFALASLMAGSGWKTFPIYQAQAQGVDGRIASALAIIGLLYVLAVSLLLLFVAGRNRGRAGDPGMPLVNK